MNRFTFEFVTHIISTIALSLTSVLLLVFSVKEEFEQGQSSDTFVPYWMGIVAVLIVLELLVSWKLYKEGASHEKCLFWSDLVLRIGVCAVTVPGVLMEFIYIQSVGGFSKAPILFIYAFSFGCIIVKVYICILLKFFILVCIRYWKGGEDRTELLYTEI
ncbi:hypothetical protein CRE_05094 [Caenorhabditis remanei]|uniref:Uncharacterized protein n=1 Tax=Caenorhabditis remanei TaxID=31234 RepID=E3MZ56_CAERE|nr:hypothetical protein CRE_05094 [Caenorhabditis remanei]